MAKVKKSIVTLSGKMGNEVFVNDPKNGPHVRKKSRPISKKVKALLKKQNRRTQYLNTLASEINSIVNAYTDVKSQNFYHDLLTRFRKETLDNRFMLLRQIIKMDVNPSYPSSKLGFCKTAIHHLKGKLIVNLEVITNPPKLGDYRVNCHYYKLVLITWTRDKMEHSNITSDWIRTTGRPEFDFEFSIPKGTLHWLLCLKQRLGHHEEEVESFDGESMQLRDAGTFVKKDEELLIERNKEKEEEKKKSLKEKPAAVARIKPKIIHPL